MTLKETVTASLVFSLAAAASLQLLDRVSASVLELERRQQRSDLLEAEMVAFESVLRSEVRQTTPMATCELAAGRWLLVLQATTPAAPELRKELSLVPSGDALQLRLAVEGLTQTRQRIYHPAAFGLCPPPSSPEVPLGFA